MESFKYSRKRVEERGIKGKVQVFLWKEKEEKTIRLIDGLELAKMILELGIDDLEVIE